MIIAMAFLSPLQNQDIPPREKGKIENHLQTYLPCNGNILFPRRVNHNPAHISKKAPEVPSSCKKKRHHTRESFWGVQNQSSASSEVISSKKPWSIWDFPGSQLGNTANLRCQHDGLSKVLEKTGKPSHSRECEGHISHLITWRWTSQTQKLLGRGWYVIVSH